MSDLPTPEPVPQAVRVETTGDFPADVVELLSRIEDLVASVRMTLAVLTCGFVLVIAFCVIVVVWLFMHSMSA